MYTGRGRARQVLYYLMCPVPVTPRVMPQRTQVIVHSDRAVLFFKAGYKYLEVHALEFG